MENVKKSLISAVATTVLCLAAGLASAIMNKWNLVSVIMLSVIVVLSVFINVVLWREIVIIKKEASMNEETDQDSKTKK